MIKSSLWWRSKRLN